MPTYEYECTSCGHEFERFESMTAKPDKSCPKCNKKTGNSPEVKRESPIPWWGSMLVIIIGIACWVVSAWLGIKGLDEAGRALVYIPLGSLFGMSLPR